MTDSSGLPEATRGAWRASGIMAGQLLAGGLFALVAALSLGVGVGLAMLYGSLLMVINAAWMGRRMDGVDGLEAEAGQRSLYQGAALRFAGLLAGLLLAGLMGLHLLFVALGMFVVQAVLFFAALRRFDRERKITKGD